MRSWREPKALTIQPRKYRRHRIMAGILSKDFAPTTAEVTHSAGVRSFDEPQGMRSRQCSSPKFEMHLEGSALKESPNPGWGQPVSAGADSGTSAPFIIIRTEDLGPVR